MARGIKSDVNRIKLFDMVRRPWLYDGLREGFEALPVPDSIRLGWLGKRWVVPGTMDELAGRITYGQRMYFARHEENDYGITLRYLAGYYQPIVTGREYSDKAALAFGGIVLHARAVEAFPVALHLVILAGQLVEREIKLLERKPTKQEKQARVDKLAKFADLEALLFLQEQFKCSLAEVARLPYADCLVRFLRAKEKNDYAERLAEVYRKEAEAKNKYKKGKK